MFSPKRWLLGLIVAASLAAAAAQPAPPPPPPMYVPGKVQKCNRLSQKGRRKRAKWN